MEIYSLFPECFRPRPLTMTLNTAEKDEGIYLWLTQRWYAKANGADCLPRYTQRALNGQIVAGRPSECKQNPDPSPAGRGQSSRTHQPPQRLYIILHTPLVHFITSSCQPWPLTAERFNLLYRKQSTSP